MKNIVTSQRLNEVRYEIRGELAHRAREIEQSGKTITRLNIGNPGVYGFRTPEHIREAMAAHLGESEAYCHEQGLTQSREAVAAQQQARGAPGASAATIFMGNGVSELIDLCLRGLLNAGDEVLVPSPDYPLWTASVLLNGGRAVHYPCNPHNGFLPDPHELEKLITPRTRALVLINPNNPTGAVYPRELLQVLADIATRHKLVIMTDEIYDEIVYEQTPFTPVAALAPETLVLSFGGLSKVHRACGYRVGWMSLSGDLSGAKTYIHALELLAALRLCSNVAGQWTVPAALNGPDSIAALVAPGGRLFESRAAVIAACDSSEFLNLAAPMGALYAFPGVDMELVPAFSDYAFALDLLEQENVLLVPGSSFNVAYRNHFRITLLPQAKQISEVFARIDTALCRWAEKPARQVGNVVSLASC